MLNLVFFDVPSLEKKVCYKVLFAGNMFYFKRSKVRGYTPYLLQTFYQLGLFCLVLPEDLVSD